MEFPLYRLNRCFGSQDLMENTRRESSRGKTWFIISLLVLLVLVQGGLAYFIVGDLGQPDWDYRPYKDVPGESPYAVYEPLPYSQHVRGRPGKE